MRSSLYIRLFFLCVAVVLVVFAVYEYRRGEKQKSVQKESALIFKSHVRENIVKFSLTKQDGSQFVVEKTKQGWNLIQPIHDLASFSAVEGLLDDIFDESAEVLSAENVQWSDYDLDPPFSILSLQSENENWSVGISGESSFDGKFYVKKGDKLLLGSSNWGRLARPWTDVYRSKSLYSKRGGISKLYYKTKNQNYEFTRKDNKWQWNLKTPLSQTSVESLIDLLKGEMISSFSNQKKTVFAKPDLEIKIVSEDQEEPWVLKLKKINEKRAQVILSDRNFIYELNAVQSFLDLDFEEKKEDSAETGSEKNTPDTE
ncbi:MAG: hypothetical protein OXK80_06350 [Bdellovibrionales bacterium]|nr:hypothetical protein [Bdellovibrionales bacterium]